MFISSHSIAFFLLIAVFCFQLDAQLQCKDDANRPVDWFLIYKIPKLSRSNNPKIKAGEAYLYMTSDTFKDGWKLSRKSVGFKTSMPGRTLSSLYGKDASIMWTVYNDQPPNKTAASSNGHTKGVVMANGNQGFWLIHSVPNFPPTPDQGTEVRRGGEASTGDYQNLDKAEYSYPSSAKHYGQSFLCISVDSTQFNLIGTQLMYNQIIPYKNNLPDKLANLYYNWTSAANKVRIKQAPFNNKVTVASLNGERFVVFAKSGKWGKDLYDEFVAPQLGSDLLTETWRLNHGNLPSDCNGTKVLNIKAIDLAEANVIFNSTHDHSKWAVSYDNDKDHNWVCVGDINRAGSQFHRGGGTVCLNSPDVWTSYRQSVQNVEPCPKKSFGTWAPTVNLV